MTAISMVNADGLGRCKCDELTVKADCEIRTKDCTWGTACTEVACGTYTSSTDCSDGKLFNRCVWDANATPSPGKCIPRAACTTYAYADLTKC